MRSLLSLFTASLISISVAGEVLAEDWPQFRGPTGQGITPETQLPITWGEPGDVNVVWKSPLIGEGHASPIVSGNRLFVCTAHWRDAITDRKQVIPEHHVLCYSTIDGKRIWDITVEPGPWRREDFRSGPGGGYAAPTPVTDGKLVYVAFGSSVIAAIDFDGKPAWRNDIVPYNFDVTVGSSPILLENSVLMLCAMTDPKNSKLISYDKATGAILRETPLPHAKFAHSTPLMIDVNGKRQLIVAASGGGESDGGIQSLDPKTGEVIWTCRAGGEAASPAFGAGIVYCDNGRGGPGIAIDPTGTGDITKTHIKWRISTIPEAIGSPIIFGNRVYRLHSPNVLKCWNAENGQQIYAQRLDQLTSSWASPIIDGAGRLYFATSGVSYVIQTGNECNVLAINNLGDPNHASPAVANAKLFLVGTKQVFCIGSK